MQESEIELPNLAGPSDRNSLSIIGPDQLTRKKLKLILHLITGELRSNGVKTPHVFLPFRSKIDDDKLEKMLTRLFPDGELLDTRDEAKVQAILRQYDDFTLICTLKYLWSRLPNHEIIGWDVYHEYKRKEKEAGYPKNAFLTIMPKCLLSPAHASIVYDFLDLLISLTANSQYNYLSGRKIAKMAALWAFNSTTRKKSFFYDATYSKENNFIDGLESWKVGSDALFHLLLSFLRAMLPESEMETLRLPKTLQSLLITNSYPPQPNNDSPKSMITIPCVLVKSTKPSSSPYELLSKVRHTVKFQKKDSFLSVENYSILKNIFQKDSTTEILSTLSEESARVLSRITADPISSDYDISPGWAKSDIETDQFIPLFSQVDIHNVTLQDYYIWTWLSSIASDQTSYHKKLFGRSLVVEAGLLGFQKWVVITEQTISSEEYINNFKGSKTTSPKQRVTSPTHSSYKDKEMPLPPPPPPPKQTEELLPNIYFDEQDHKIDVQGIEPDENEHSDYRKYINSLEDLNENEFAGDCHIRTSRSKNSKSSSNRRKPPSPMDQEYLSISQTAQTAALSNLHLSSPQEIVGELHSPTSRPLSNQSGYATARDSYPTSQRDQYYSPQGAFEEPYDNYETPYELRESHDATKGSEPFENYNIPGAQHTSPNHQHAQQVADPQPQYEQPQYEQLDLQEIHECLLPQQLNETDISLSPEYIQEPQFAALEDSEEARKKKEERRKRRKEKKRKEKEKEKANAAMFPFPYGMFPLGPPPGMENMPPPGMENMPPNLFPIPHLMEPVSPKKKDKKKKKREGGSPDRAKVLLNSGSDNVPTIACTSASSESSPAQPRNEEKQSPAQLRNNFQQVLAQPRNEVPAVIQKKCLPEVPTTQHSPQHIPQPNSETRPNSEVSQESLATLWSLSPSTRRNPELPPKLGMPYFNQSQPPESVGSPKFGLDNGQESPSSGYHSSSAVETLNSHHSSGHRSANNLPIYRSQPAASLGYQSAPHLPHASTQANAGPSPQMSQTPRNQKQQPHHQPHHHQTPTQSAAPAPPPGGAHPAYSQQPYYPPPGQQPYYPPPGQHQYYHPPGQQPYYPPPPGQQPYYPPPGQQPYYPPGQQPYYPPGQQPYYPPAPHPGTHHPGPPTKPSTSDVTMMGMPTGSKFNKNKANKADLRAAFNNNTFGI
jgi:Vesicle coat complex COPII, subunit SEC24/subunit SFB2/subunit SFB3